jgi:hypothetical protein
MYGLNGDSPGVRAFPSAGPYSPQNNAVAMAKMSPILTWVVIHTLEAATLRLAQSGR